MRTGNIEIKFILPIPVDRPDSNGNTYTKDSVLEAFDRPLKNIGIVFMSNDPERGKKIVGMTDKNDYKGYQHNIGFVKDSKIIEYNEITKTVNVEVTGTICYGGTIEFVDVDNKIINRFRVDSIGFSEWCFWQT